MALLAVSSTLFTSSTRGPVLAADPVAEAKAQRDAIERQLSDERAKLHELQATSAALSDQLASAELALADANAEYERVTGLLHQVQDDVNATAAHLADLLDQIKALDTQLQAVASDIADENDQLQAREALLQDHIRAAYEQSQTSLLEILISAPSLDAATNQVSYLLTISDQDKALADEIRVLRAQLQVKQGTLRDGRSELWSAQAQASAEERTLKEREAQLKDLEAQAAKLKAAAEKKRAEQAAVLNASLAAQGNVAEQVSSSQQAFAAANQLYKQLYAQQQALEEARRKAAEEAQRGKVSSRGFRWPEVGFHVTQEWGPTSFVLEPPYTYRGVYYPHFHGGIDIATGCGTPIVAAGTGVVVASGQPLWPYDSGYGVVIDHGGGIQTWYWHLLPRVIVHPGQPITIGTVLGYEGATGNATGCHLHFAVNDHGVWENPRNYLP